MIKGISLFMLLILCMGGFLTGCQDKIDNPILSSNSNLNSNPVNLPRVNLVMGGSALFFGGWRPPISLDKPFTPGMQVPVKFIVVDSGGNPVTSGVDAVIIIGDATSDQAVLDDAATGQWTANITLPAVGTYDVILIGNVMNVTPLSITVAESVPEGDITNDSCHYGCGNGYCWDGWNGYGWGNWDGYCGNNNGCRSNDGNTYGNNTGHSGNCGGCGNNTDHYGNGGGCGNNTDHYGNGGGCGNNTDHYGNGGGCGNNTGRSGNGGTCGNNNKNKSCGNTYGH
ncbi:MAG: hypothetical protein ABSB78_12915 [Bacteroidota bacterium]